MALVGPVFILMIVFLFETFLYFFVQQALDTATASAARQIQIGNAQGQAPSSAAFLSSVLCPNLSGLLSCGNVQLTVSTVANFYDTAGYTVPTKNGQLDTTQFPYCNAAPGQLVLVHAVYLAPVWFASFFSTAISYGGSAVLPIVSTAAFITESFPSTGTVSNGC
ncbi:MAG: pilus assembly protein [Acidisphaera sp.]|nr:pilus assembly protein [Acidisphaera sp.]